MSGTAGYNGWKWIFILGKRLRCLVEHASSLQVAAEGIFTALCGAMSYFFLSDYPETEKFLNEDERAWTIYRKATDGTSHGEHTGLDWTQIRSGLFNWQVYISTAYYLSIVTPLYSIGLSLPSIINGFGQVGAKSDFPTAFC